MKQRTRVAILADFPMNSLDQGALGRGGGQGCTWLPQLALSFENRAELEVHWIVLDRNSRSYRTRVALGQTFHSVPAVPFSVDLALNYLPARWGLRRVIRRIRPDVVHAWGAERIYPAALQDFSGPRVFSLQGSLSYYQKIGGLPDDWRWRKMVSTEPDFARSANVVTAESLWAKERVLELDPDADCRVVDYGAHPSFFETRWRPDPGRPVALYIGGGGYRKGIDVLLKSLKRCSNRNWTMAFAGDELLRKEVDAAGLERCEYLGMLSWDKLLTALSEAWCVVVPTRADTGPTVVKEARVVGVPVIGTVHGGLRDYVHDGLNGLTVDPLNEENLAKALEDVMGSFASARQLGEGRHEQDRACFDPKLTARKLADIYLELAGRKDRERC